MHQLSFGYNLALYLVMLTVNVRLILNLFYQDDNGQRKILDIMYQMLAKFKARVVAATFSLGSESFYNRLHKLANEDLDRIFKYVRYERKMQPFLLTKLNELDVEDGSVQLGVEGEKVILITESRVKYEFDDVSEDTRRAIAVSLDKAQSETSKTTDKTFDDSGEIPLEKTNIAKESEGENHNQETLCCNQNKSEKIEKNTTNANKSVKYAEFNARIGGKSTPKIVESVTTHLNPEFLKKFKLQHKPSDTELELQVEELHNNLRKEIEYSSNMEGVAHTMCERMKAFESMITTKIDRLEKKYEEMSSTARYDNENEITKVNARLEVLSWEGVLSLA
uniref:Uncharacterized protein n=1 Tax=Trichogramma kaykai TaxID=54128 RepID=A0ABD2XLC1_9HYME